MESSVCFVNHILMKKMLLIYRKIFKKISKLNAIKWQTWTCGSGLLKVIPDCTSGHSGRSKDDWSAWFFLGGIDVSHIWPHPLNDSGFPAHQSRWKPKMSHIFLNTLGRQNCPCGESCSTLWMFILSSVFHWNCNLCHYASSKGSSPAIGI